MIRRAPPLLLGIVLLGAASARAQQPYEPDQRGAGDPGDPEPYEPDQRGGIDQEVDAAGTAVAAEPAWEEYDADARGPVAQMWTGVSLVGLDALGGDDLVRPDQRGGLGLGGSVVLGFRLGSLTLGPRLDLAIHEDFILWKLALDAELAFEGEVAPFLRASLGFARVASLADASEAQSEQPVAGLGAEIGAGLRWMLGAEMFVGGELAASLLALGRGAAPECMVGCTADDFDLRREGDGLGLGLRISVGTGVRF